MARTRRRSIVIKDADGEVEFLFAAADWKEQEKRVAIARICRLVSLPVSNYLTCRSGNGHA